jgi:hypothetical protein
VREKEFFEIEERFNEMVVSNPNFPFVIAFRLFRAATKEE